MDPGRVKAPSSRLLIRPGAIGDFLVSLPALQHLKAPYTEVWCAEQNVPLARFADCALSIGRAGLDRIGLLPADDVFEHLRRFDEIHSWYGAANDAFRASVSGFPFQFHAAIPPADCGMNATAYHCRQVGAPDGLPVIDTGQQPRSDLVILHPFASNPAKRWPIERFRTLAGMLAHVTWCAGPEEPFAGAVRIDNLFELARWIGAARAYVGNDSGITHLAAAVGTPVVALFGASDPRIWAPRGPRVKVLARTPIDAIVPEDVLAALQGLI